MIQISQETANQSLSAISAFASTLPSAQAVVLNALIQQLAQSFTQVPEQKNTNTDKSE